MARRWSVLALVTILGLVGCSEQPPKPDAQVKTEESQQAVAQVGQEVYRIQPVHAKPGLEFTRSLLQDFASQKGNVMVSPYGAQTVVEAFRFGTTGEVDKQLATFIHQKGKSEYASDSTTFTRLSLKNLIKAEVLTEANGLWVKEGKGKVEQKFVDKCKRSVGSEVHSFQDPSTAVKEINSFVDTNTRHMIPSVLDSLDSLDIAIIVNCLAFQDSWMEPFEESQTTSQPFHAANGTDVKVPTMTASRSFYYADQPHYQLVQLPYLSGLQMTVVLPKAGYSLESILADPDLLTDPQNKASNTPGQVWLPKWESKFTFNIRDFMIKKGLSKPFTSSMTDFVGISKDITHISQFFQQTYVKVDEKGTKAAAATIGVATAEAASPDPVKPFTFRADHPFAYFIGVPGKFVLFAGIVNDPTG